MDRTLSDLLDRARAAVVVKDAGGYCVYANRREEELHGAETGGLLGRHVTEFVNADPRLVEREWERFRQEGSWVGQFRTQGVVGEPVRFRAYNFTHREWDGSLQYVSFTYPLGPFQKIDSDGPILRADSAITSKDVCLAQFYADGYSDDDICTLFGVSVEDLALQTTALITRAGTKSKTEAFISMLKEGFIA